MKPDPWINTTGLTRRAALAAGHVQLSQAAGTLATRLPDVPVFVLTSDRTFSAAEEFILNAWHLFGPGSQNEAG